MRPVTMTSIRRLSPALGRAGVSLLTLALLAGASPARAQEGFLTDSEGVITIARGASTVLTRADTITRLTIADGDIAEALAFPPNQFLINGKQVGTTSLVIWGRSGRPQMYTLEVTADIASLQRQFDDLFGGEQVTVSSTGSTLILSGEVRDPAVVRQALALAETLEIPVINNIQAPAPEQILLHVEFAEVSRSVLKELGGDLVRALNPATMDEVFDKDDTHYIETASEGLITIMLEGDRSALDVFIRALKSTGEFRSLAQPNLVTREGVQASFLAGGEFPFPTIQGSQSNAVTITWKEYGVRLNFTPTIQNSGNIRLQVEPEVSSLDFANGLTLQGFAIPSILTRRVQTDVELKPGQTLAIGGLMDNQMLTEADKIPLLGDLPIIGFFFKSKSARQNRSELLVLVTPYVLDDDDLPAPPVPTGVPADWKWDGHIGNWIRERADTVSMSGRMQDR
ncbi:MAG: pilus assembly protein N-terminal domain-containing protein [Gemmatimonadota bacterium]